MNPPGGAFSRVNDKGGVTRFTLSALCLAAMTLAAAALIFLRLPPGSIAVYLGYQLVAVALPGLTLVKLFRLRLTPLETLTLAYALGLLVNIAVYFLLAPLYLQRFVPHALALAAAVSLAGQVLMRRRPLYVNRDSGELKIGLAAAFAAAVMSFLLLSAPSLTPDISGTRAYYHDLLNGVSLITSASNGFPLEFLQMAHTKHYYHPFFYGYCAAMKLSLGLDSFSIAVNFSLISLSPFFAAAFVCVAHKVFANVKLTALSAVLLYAASYPIIYYTNVDMLGFPLGLGFMLVAVLLFFTAEGEDRSKTNRYHVLSAVFVAACTGAKGPIGVNAVFSICFVLLLGLFRERAWQKTLVSGLIYAASFFSTYFLLYQSGAESMYLRRLIKDEVNRGSYYHTLPESWPEDLRRLVSNITYTFAEHRLAVVCFAAALVLVIALRKKRCLAAEYAVGGAAAGFVLVNTFLQHGSSEIYFVYAVLPVAVIALVCALKALFERFRGKRRAVVGAAAAVALVSLLYAPFAEVAERVPQRLIEAIAYSVFSDKLIVSDGQIAAMSVGERANAITPGEYEGLVFIRDNTPKDAVVAEGRHLEHNKFFYGSALGERRFFLEGWGYVTMEDSNENTPAKVAREAVTRAFYRGQDEGFVPLLRHSGIDYVIIYDYFNPGWKLSGEFGSTPVFENADIAVYDIREPEN